MSFRLKTMLGIALIEGLFLLFLVYTSIDYLRQSNEAEILKRAQSMAVLMAASAKDAVISTDLSTLEALVEEVIRHQQVHYVEIYNNQGILVSRGDLSEHEHEPELAKVHQDLVAVEAQIQESGYAFGKVELGINTQEFSTFLHDASRHILSIALIEIVLVGLFSWALGALLSRKLLQLRDASLGLLVGESHTPLPVDGDDEIAMTAKAFNAMGLRVSERTEALKQANVRLSTILDTATDGYIIMDNKGFLREANTAVYQLFGYAQDELDGAQLSVLMPEDGVSIHQDYIQTYISNPDSADSCREVSAVTKDGRRFPIELHVTAMPLGDELLFLGLIEDLTIEKRRQADVRRSESILVATINASRDAFIAIDADGFVREFNESACHMFEYLRSEVLGQPLEKLIIPAEHQDAHRQGMLQFHLTGEGPILNRHLELSACTKTGTLVPVELSVIPIRLENEVLFAAFLRDISERKQRESELNAAKLLAEEGSKAKSRFLATMSHEIRSPLNAVLGCVTLLLDSSLNKEQRLYVNTAREAGSALLSTINDILDFSKIEAGQMVLESHSFEPDKLVAQVLQILAPKAQEKGIQLASFINRNVPQFLVGDGQRFRQVIYNLVDNAIKFSSAGAVLVQMWIPDSHQERVELKCSVTDHGIGMSDSAQQKLFTEFSQVHDGSDTSYKGTGLGLAICAELLRMMGGGIKVDSTLGVGSCFTATAVFDINAQEPIHFWHLPEHPRVLLMHPDDDVAALVRKQYSQYGVDCVCFPHVEACINARHGSGRFMLIMIDDTCLRSLTARHCQLLNEGYLHREGHLVALVSGVRAEVQSMLGDLGIRYQVNKPLSRAMLLELVSTVPDDSGSNVHEQQQTLAGRRILLAEDSPANQLVAAALLSQEGASVDIAANGEEACVKAALNKYDLILMDVRMPIKDGLQASRDILAADSANTILAMTANVFKEELDACIEAGMLSVISKPIAREDLLKRIGEWLPQKTNAVIAKENPATTILNDEVLCELEAALGRDRVNSMMQVFWQETDERLVSIDKHWRSQEWQRLEDEAHTLKSSSGSFGAKLLYELARSLEEQARQKRAAGIGPLIENIKACVAESHQAIAVRYQTEGVAANDI